MRSSFTPISTALQIMLGLPQPLVGRPASLTFEPASFAGQRTAEPDRRAKRLRVRQIGRRQERRERCRGYALKAESALLALEASAS